MKAVKKVYKYIYRDTPPIIGVGWTIGIIYYLFHLISF